MYFEFSRHPKVSRCEACTVKIIQTKRVKIYVDDFHDSVIYILGNPEIHVESKDVEIQIPSDTIPTVAKAWPNSYTTFCC